VKRLLTWVKAHKFITTIAVLAVIVIGVSSNGSKGNTASPANTKKTTPQAAASAPRLSYTVAEDKQTYVAVVVPASYDNTNSMKRLGQTLEHDYNTSDRSHVFVYVFDNATAASYLDAVLHGQNTSAQDAVYDPHFVAEYQKNAPTNLSRFTIQLSGGDKDPNPVVSNI
jgi:hypothetical protein